MESFSAAAKREMCRVPPHKACCALSECYGALLMAHTFSATELRLISTHGVFVARLRDLLRQCFGVQAQLDDGRRRLVLTVTDGAELQRIRAAFGYDGKTGPALHLNNAVLENECCLAAFWRGVFCAGGTMASPEKKYQLDIATPHRFLARELLALLHESDLEAGLTQRGGVQVIFFKSGERIEQFLVLTGAPVAAMEIMNQQILKGVSNNVNRQLNCDSYNVGKTVRAGERYAAAVQRLQSSERWSALPEELKRTALARRDRPEETLTDLAASLGVTKSCLNHRLRKIAALANSLPSEQP